MDFTFEGDRNNELTSINAGTSFEVCCSTDALFQRDISNDASELASLYDCLGREITSIQLGDGGRKLCINLSDGHKVFVWSLDSPTDNFLVIRNINNDEWGVLG